jgi:3-phenylpropionate/trans-cinnamate dioxygenase ferredoxin reductase subunit
MPSNETFVIVGAGLAGAKAAETLRQEGFEGRLVLVGDEPERPYERPPLSKDFLRGETTEPPYVHPEDFYDEHGVELRLSRAVRLNPVSRELSLEDGSPIHFDRLLLATGAEPRRLELPGAELDGVLQLRTLEDSRRLGARLEPGRRLVVVGSGWIGCEVAASARQKGCEVTVLEMGALPLERVLGPELGRVYLELHSEHGVEILAHTTAARFEGDGTVSRVVTNGGAAIEADTVVVGIGVLPRTELAESAGLAVGNGVRVDERLEASVPGIFAAGDVADAFHPVYGQRIRVEHWANALRQGEVAARSMLGRPAAHEEIPYFFSDQYDAGMEYSGFAREWDEVVFRGDRRSREFIAFWRKDERVVAGMNMNVWDVHDEIRGLIRSRLPVSFRDLEDKAIPLSRLLPSEEEQAASGTATEGSWG